MKVRESLTDNPHATVPFISCLSIYFMDTTQHQTAFNDKGRIKSKLYAILVKLLHIWLRHYKLPPTDTEGTVCTVPSLSQQRRHCYTYLPSLGYKHATQGGSAYATGGRPGSTPYPKLEIKKKIGFVDTMISQHFTSAPPPPPPMKKKFWVRTCFKF